MNSAKKSETIEVRLPFAVKQAFAERCRAEGVTMSDAMRQFIARRSRGRAGSLPPLAVALGLAVAMVMAPPASQPDYGVGFEALDRNGDAVLTRAELPEDSQGCAVPLALPLRRLGLGNGPREFVTCKELPGFSALDHNGDGLIRREEFAAARLDLLRRGYDAFDVDRDGTLDPAEYARAGKTVFLGTAPALAKFADLDRNGDRRVTFSEFLR